MSAPLLPLRAEPDRAEPGNPALVVITADRSDTCSEAVMDGQRRPHETGLPRIFSLLNWNVEKAQHPELVGAFARPAKQSDLIFIQEAVPVAKIETVISQSLYQAFVRGYVQDEISTGVLTLRAHPNRFTAISSRQSPGCERPKPPA